MSSTTDELRGGARIFAEFEKERKAKIKSNFAQESKNGEEWCITIKLRNFENDKKNYVSQL